VKKPQQILLKESST